MKFLSICLAVIGLAVTSVTSAQSGCKFGSSYSSILSAVKSRMTRTDDHKMSESEMQNMARYWEADCKCRNGVNTLEEARELHRKAFSYNTGSKGDIVTQLPYRKKDISYMGDMVPPFATFTASSCVKGNGGGNFGSSLAANTDCVPEASRISELDGQLGAYASQFFFSYCQCRAGVATQEEADMLIKTMKVNHETFNDFRNAQTPPLNTKPLNSCQIRPGGGGNSAVDDFQRSMRNLQKADNIIREAEARNAFVAEQLAQFAQIAANGDPFSIMQQYQQNVQSIQELSDQFRGEAWMSSLNNTAGVIDDYKSGNAEGAFYGGLATAVSIVENAETRKEIERQKQELELKRSNAMVDAANQMIESNNKAGSQWWTSACQATDEQQEDYFRAMAYHHFGFSNYINRNFSDQHTRWAQYNRAAPQQPRFGSFYTDNARFHHRAAIRKVELYREMKTDGNHGSKYLDEWFSGALDQYAAALAADPGNANYYVEMAEVAKDVNAPLALQAFASAYHFDRSAITDEQMEHFESLLDTSAEEVAQYIEADRADDIKPYIDFGLYTILRPNGESLWNIAMRHNAPKVISLLYLNELSTQTPKEKQQAVKEGALVAAAYDNVSGLDFLASRGVSLDFKFKGKSPIQVAAQEEALATFKFLLEAQPDRFAAQEPYEGSKILILALSDRYPQEAAGQLRAMRERDQVTALKGLLEEGRRDQAFFQPVTYFNDAPRLIRDNPELQAVAQSYVVGKKQSYEDLEALDLEADVAAFNTDSQEALAIAMYENRAIMDAIEAGDVELAARLSLELQAQATGGYGSDQSSLMRSMNTVKYLLQNGCYAQEFVRSESVALTDAAITADDPELYRLLQDMGALSPVDSQGLPLAYRFVSDGSRILNSGAANGVDFSLKTSEGESIVHYLIFNSGKNQELILGMPGIDVNIQGPYKWTPLHYAVRENKVELVRALVRAGANPKAKDKWGRKPIDIAKERDHEEILAYLKSL